MIIATSATTTAALLTEDEERTPRGFYGRATGRLPFHTEAERWEVFETGKEGTFYVEDTRGPNSYVGDMTGVARFIEREKGIERRGTA